MLSAHQKKCSPALNNTLAVLNSTQISGAMARETITISSVASLERQVVTIDSDSNELTFPYGFGSQHPIVPPSPHGSQPVAQPIQCVGYYGRDSIRRRIQPPITGAVSPVPNFYAPMNMFTTEG